MSGRRRTIGGMGSCLIVLMLTVAWIAQPAAATNKFYVGLPTGGTGTWNNTANWSLTATGLGNAGVPTTADLVALTNSDGNSRTVMYDYTGAAVSLGQLQVDLTGGTNNATNVISMAGNTLTVAGAEEFGFTGHGAFIQSGGSNTINGNNLFLAHDSGSTGIYFLSGASTQLTVNGNEYIGNGGAGTFNQSGGTNTLSGFMILGQTNGTSSGAYTLSGGSLAVGQNIAATNASQNEVVGYNAGGTFTQTGGSNTIGTSVSLQNLYVGYVANVLGAYVMNSSVSTATLTVTGDEYVAYQGIGSFTQSGGVHTVGGLLHVGGGSGGSGTFALSGGSLATAGENIGDSGTGSFTQTGGSNTLSAPAGLSQLDIGHTSVGSYTMSNSGAALMVVGNELIGDSATSVTMGGATQTGGTFVQSAGTHTITGYLDLGETPVGTGSFLLSGGSLAVSTTGAPHFNGEDIGYAGSGSFVQSGGTHVIGTSLTNQDLNLGYFVNSSGTYTMNSAAAKLTVNGNAYIGGNSFGAGGMGVMNVSAGAATVTGTLKIWPTAGNAVNLSGGSLTVGSLDAASFSRLNWTGGMLGFSGNVNQGTGEPLGTGFLFIGTGKTLAVAGTFTVDAGNDVALQGGQINATAIAATGSSVFLNSGTLNVSSLTATSLIVTMPVSFGNGTSLNVSDINLSGGAQMTINGASGSASTLEVNEPTASFVQYAGTFSVGTFTVQSGSTFTIPTGGYVNTGNFHITSPHTGSVVNLTGGFIYTALFGMDAAAALNITAGGLVISPDFGTSGNPADLTDTGSIHLGSYTNATISVIDGGVVNSGTISGSGQIYAKNSMTNSGTLSVGAGDHLSYQWSVNNASGGQINLAAGTMDLAGIDNLTGGALNFTGGVLNVTALIAGNTSGIINASGATISGHGAIQNAFPIDNAGKIQLSGGNSDIYPGVTNEATGVITVTGGSTATFYGAMTLKAGSALTVDINSTAVFFGSLTGTATITGAGVLDFEGGHSATPALANLGGLTVGGQAALTVPSVQAGAVVVQGNLVIGPTAPAQPKVLNTANTLTVTTGANFDLTNTDLLVHAGSVATVQGWMALGEIHSSSATANLTGLGLLSGADYLTLHGAAASFDGAAVLSTDVLVRYTYLGDATLDGKITVADYAQIDAAFLLHQTASWLTGDFNLDGVVNYKDYALIDNAYRNQSGALADGEIAAHAAEFGPAYVDALETAGGGGAAVPEPGSLGLAALGIGLGGLIGKKRARSNHDRERNA